MAATVKPGAPVAERPRPPRRQDRGRRLLPRHHRRPGRLRDRRGRPDRHVATTTQSTRRELPRGRPHRLQGRHRPAAPGHAQRAALDAADERPRQGSGHLLQRQAHHRPHQALLPGRQPGGHLRHHVHGRHHRRHPRRARRARRPVQPAAQPQRRTSGPSSPCSPASTGPGDRSSSSSAWCRCCGTAPSRTATCPTSSTTTCPARPPTTVFIHANIGDYQVTPLGAELIARSIGAKNLSPTNRDVFGIPDAPSPIDGSAIVEWSWGLLPAPETNVPPSDLCPTNAPPGCGDPHQLLRSQPGIDRAGDPVLQHRAGRGDLRRRAVHGYVLTG